MEPRVREVPLWVVFAGMAGALLLGALIFGIPSLIRMRHRSRIEECADHLRQIGTNFSTYEAKFGSYPTPGDKTWFGLLWTTGIASDGDIFRCPIVGLRGTGTHFRGITGPGHYTGNGAGYYWTTSLSEGAPPDLEMACDDDQGGVPNHVVESERNILVFQGRVKVCAIGSPSESIAFELLQPTTRGWAAPAGTK